jgi:hypothetical protein
MPMAGIGRAFQSGERARSPLGMRATDARTGARPEGPFGSALEEHTDKGDGGEHADPEQAELRDADHGGLYAIQMVGMVMIQDGHGRLLIFP